MINKNIENLPLDILRAEKELEYHSAEAERLCAQLQKILENINALNDLII